MDEMIGDWEIVAGDLVMNKKASIPIDLVSNWVMLEFQW